ncbi:endo-1,4-beta-xylanase, partial [Russula earlei]
LDTTLKAVAPFPFGAAVNVNLLQHNTSYATIVGREYNNLTPENAMKFATLHPSQNTYNWTDGDYLVNYAQQNGQRVHGHTLIWYNSLPSWVTNFTGDSAAWENLMKTHIQTVVTHYKGQLRSWDVVNEAFNDDGTLRNSVWLQHLGPNFIARCFQYAHTADSSALLFYNDYGYEYSSAKLAAIVSLVTTLQNNGIPIDGVGMQTHINKTTSYSGLNNAINTVAQTGLMVHISELDIAMNPSNTPGLTYTNTLSQQQADLYKYVARLYRTVVPTAQQYGMTTWDVTDADSWIPGTYSRPDWPLPFDSSYHKKRAYYELVDGL